MPPLMSRQQGPRGSSKHRPGFHVLVLVTGFIAGGLVQVIVGKVLPPGPARDFLTAGVTPQIGPLPVDLILLNFSVGPLAIEFSLLRLVGVIVAYLIARSLF